MDGKTNTDTIWGKKSSFGSCLKEFSNGRGIWITSIEITSPQMIPVENILLNLNHCFLLLLCQSLTHKLSNFSTPDYLELMEVSEKNFGLMLFSHSEGYRLQAKFGFDLTHMKKKRVSKTATWLSVNPGLVLLLYLDNLVCFCRWMGARR